MQSPTRPTSLLLLLSRFTRPNSPLHQKSARSCPSPTSTAPSTAACLHTRTSIPQAAQAAGVNLSAVIRPRRRPIMPNLPALPTTGRRRSSTSAKGNKELPEARPSSSILLLSSTNQVLLLHRVKTSTSFASAHVFPGGNLSEFHDGPVPPPGDPRRHADSLAYRLGAIRETFEESGILLVRKGNRGGPLLKLPPGEREWARKAVYENKINFTKWVERIGGVIDTENLLPFTRWVTPTGPNRRFTTQMYVYMLPLESETDHSLSLSSSSSSSDPIVSAARQHQAVIPTPDGGAEVTTAHFDDAVTWLDLQRRGEITLFPPQYFLLHLLAKFLTGEPLGALDPDAGSYYRAQRERLRAFLRAVPTSAHPAALSHPTSHIPWADKVISPTSIGLAKDGRTILALDKPGSELIGSGRGGDWERVVLVRFARAGPVSVEVRGREEVLAQEREAKGREEAKL